jgi:cysteine-rich repeat protein
VAYDFKGYNAYVRAVRKIPVCGDGVIDTGEQCDDGNTNNGDCCDAVCQYEAGPCDDADACTTSDTCTSGVCVGGPPLDCDDSNPCTADSCDAVLACQYVPMVGGTPCPDGDLCNGDETCYAGVCTAGTPLDCNDGIACTDDSCNSVTGCVNTPNHALCDDADPCTDDICLSGSGCMSSTNSAPCDDGLFCNGSDTCEAASCSLHTGNPCAFGPECADSCNEEADHCFDPSGTACTDDGNICTDNECDGAGSCAANPNTVSCDDGLFCTGTDTCSAGSCTHTGDPCVEGPECADSCNEEADHCNEPSGTACTDDGNVCTDNECNGAGSCVANPNTVPCDDDLFCNGTDTCSGGGCSAHSGDPCGIETCNEATDACEECQTGADCFDANICTDDVCNAGTCENPNISGPCDDTDACTIDDQCQDGSCVGDPDICGDGVRQSECGEQCDDGNTDPGDGCSAVCELELPYPVTQIIDPNGDGAGHVLTGPYGIAADGRGNVYVTGVSSDNAFREW